MQCRSQRGNDHIYVLERSLMTKPSRQTEEEVGAVMWAAGVRGPAGAEAESALTRMSSGTEGRRRWGNRPRLTWAESDLSASSQAQVAQGRFSPPSPPLWPGRGGACHSRIEVNCHYFIFSARNCAGPERPGVGNGAGQRQRGAGHPGRAADTGSREHRPRALPSRVLWRCR